MFNTIISIHYSTNPRNVPPTPAEQPSNFSSDSTSSTVATSPNSSAVSNSTSSTAPNSPISNNQQLPTTNNALPHASSTPVNHDKRYSFNAVGGHASNTANAGNDQTRHRLEIIQCLSHTSRPRQIIIISIFFYFVTVKQKQARLHK